MLKLDLRDNRTRMARRPATIRQVAAAARVSVATVSRTLERPDVVAPDTLERVRSVIERLRYTPNAQARMLRTSRTGLVVALVPDIANPFFSEVIRGIERVAHAGNYAVLLGDTQHDPARESSYIRMLARRQADGLITLLPHLPSQTGSSRYPVVNACEYVPNSGVTTVSVDNVAGAVGAIDHLAELGHRQIAYISGPPPSAICLDRERGYRKAMRRHHLRVDPETIGIGDFSVESGIAVTRALLKKGGKFTAIFCANDEMAIGAIQELQAHRLRVPTDVSVVGFDDIRFAQYANPPLTTVSQPKLELGQAAMQCLLDLLNEASSPVRTIVLPTALIVRKSTAPPPQDGTLPRRRSP